jgi:tetraacyldisaccharide 4'-kinase
MDDGFSHHRLRRDLDLLVVDADLGLGNGRMLPVGPLREPVSAARRAGLVWLTRATPGEVPPAPLAGMPFVRSGWRPVGVSDAGLRVTEDLSVLRGARVAAFCAIARPEAFRRTLAGLGADLVHFASFADHHTPSPAELDRVRAAARAAGAERLLCTEKDLVRLDAAAAAGVGALAMEAHLLGDEGPLDAALARVLGRFA